MRPQQVSALMNYFIEDIAVGVDHTLALTSLGDVWAWGNNADGQLGLGHTSSPIREPHIVPGLEGKDIRQVRYSPLSLKDVWSWGSYADRQLGLGHTSSPIREPYIVPDKRVRAF